LLTPNGKSDNEGSGSRRISEQRGYHCKEETQAKGEEERYLFKLFFKITQVVDDFGSNIMRNGIY
jgi:hypothetical protein